MSNVSSKHLFNDIQLILIYEIFLLHFKLAFRSPIRFKQCIKLWLWLKNNYFMTKNFSYVGIIYLQKEEKGKSHNSSWKDIAKLRCLVNWTIQYIISEHWCDFLRAIPFLLTDNKEVGLHNFTKHVFDAGHFPAEQKHLRPLDIV